MRYHSTRAFDVAAAIAGMTVVVSPSSSSQFACGKGWGRLQAGPTTDRPHWWRRRPSATGFPSRVTAQVPSDINSKPFAPSPPITASTKMAVDAPRSETSTRISFCPLRRRAVISYGKIPLSGRKDRTRPVHQRFAR